MHIQNKNIERFALFGATGRTGIPLIKQGLAAGYAINAFVRTPSKLTVTHPNLQVIQGDVMQKADVERAILGTDAVISVLGHVPGGNTPANMQTTAIDHIIAIMQDQNISRLISLTGAGVRVAEDKPKLIDKIVGLILKLTQGKILKDAENHFELIQKSADIEWTVVRGPMLTEKPAVGSIKSGYLGQEVGIQLTREDLAKFMLDQLKSEDWMRKAPVVSN